MKLIKIIILINLLGIINLFSQEISFEARIDTNNVLIGDHVNLQLEFKSKKRVNVVMPEIGDTINKLEVLFKNKIDTIDHPDNFKIIQKLTITSFDSGTFEIPPFTALFEKDSFSTMYPIESNSLSLKFNTVQVDTTQAFKDIKDVIDVPFNINDYLVYIYIFIFIIIIAIALIYYFKKIKNKKIINDIGYDPKIPPYILAYESLKQLDSEKLWQKGFIKEYYIRLTDIIRIYMKRQLNINAMEMISEEIINALKELNLNIQLLNKMETLFQTSDLVKFAKSEPLPDINTLCLNIAFEFIEQTKPNIQETNKDN